ncbi:Formate dehydrogenase-O, gamma subunit [uncultured Candidatus Thioglobus sp.]|nr:Formate dehydrogenase-O, gamma subunit [uncultured Candidatus Thioglobus sp.]SMM98891.1 Formate dehydrogenase-O, gamma subunit [uncultured Candidatus Thioglobus sp.]
MNSFTRVFILFFLLFGYSFAAEKTIDAPAYTQQLNQLYLLEDTAIKTPKKIGYSGVPGSSFWRQVRSGESYSTQIIGDDSGVFINAYGEDWRLIKNQIADVNLILVPLALITVVLIYFIFGKFKLSNGFSGNMVERFKFIEMVIHWGTASTFIILAITGLILLFGRLFLIPILGKDTFAGFAEFAMDTHDIIGPIFSVFLIAMIIKFIKDNVYQKGDINWLLTGGGLFGKHVDAWRFNLGEKAWFWIVFFVGLLVTFSGYIMLFTGIVSGQREAVEIMNILHTASATLMILAMFGHVYMGVALEGSMSAMTTGKVDENWAKDHHSLWYKDTKKQ